MRKDLRWRRYSEQAPGEWTPETVVKVHAVNGLDVRSGTLVLGVGAGVTNIFQVPQRERRSTRSDKHTQSANLQLQTRQKPGFFACWVVAAERSPPGD